MSKAAVDRGSASLRKPSGEARPLRPVLRRKGRQTLKLDIQPQLNTPVRSSGKKSGLLCEAQALRRQGAQTENRMIEDVQQLRLERSP